MNHKMKLSSITHLLLLLCFTLATFKAAESGKVPPFACDTSNPLTKTYPFCKFTLPISERAKDLVSRLTLDEKISQLVDNAPGIPRLGIPAYEWWSEALHGLSYYGSVGTFFNGSLTSATGFPQVISTAATFDSKRWYRIAQAIGVEARAFYNAGEAHGMTFWAPNINIFRDPRWGRGQETAGEDPLLNGKYAISYVRGIQGDKFEGGGLKDGHLQASACCKHFTAYDLDNWGGSNRLSYNAKVSKQDLADTYQPPFQSCIQHAKASGIMCAYNRVNGVPPCANKDLLSNLARNQWGFQGYITSDCGGVEIIYEKHKFAKTPEDAVAQVLKAGMDVECGSYLKNYTKSAVHQKKVLESDIDRALHNLFTMRMRLGLFNGNPALLPYGSIGPDRICSKDHLDLALEAARNGIVLLKNSAKLLPLKKNTISSLAILGPNANHSNYLFGNYASPPCKRVEALEAFQRYETNTHYNEGCNFFNCSSASINEAVKVAKNVDYVVLFMGYNPREEREDLDLVDLVLPGWQTTLINAVAKAAKKPVILVLICGGPVDITFAKRHPKIGGILWAGYPGETANMALAEIIFGDHNPGGKLPMTWYPNEFAKIPMTDMRMRPQPSTGYPGRTYRFYTGKKVYPFGYGLSYSNYTYKFITVTQNIFSLSEISTNGATLQNTRSLHYTSVMDIETKSCQKAKFSATIGIQNHGEMHGTDPVLLFVKYTKVGNGKPMKQLAAFESVKTKAGEKVEVTFVISPCEHFRTANEDGLMVIEEGPHYLMVGDQQYPISVLP